MPCADLTTSVNALATAAQWFLVMVYFSGVIIRLDGAVSANLFIGPLLLGIIISLFVFSFYLQRSSGSAMHEVELIMAESERREQELHLDVFEMRSDMKNLQILLETNKSTDKVDPHPSSLLHPGSRVKFKPFSYQRESIRKSQLKGASPSKTEISSSEGTSPPEKGAEICSPKKCVLSSKKCVLSSKKCVLSTASLQGDISLSNPLYPCYVMSLKNLQKLDRLITHEDALDRGLLEMLTASTRRPSCAFTYFISQTWEGKTHPDNDRNTKLHWLKNLRDHFRLQEDDDVRIPLTACPLTDLTTHASTHFPLGLALV